MLYTAKIPLAWKKLLQLSAEECAALERPGKAISKDDPNVYSFDQRYISAEGGNKEHWAHICVTLIRYPFGWTKGTYTLEVGVADVYWAWDIKEVPFEMDVTYHDDAEERDILQVSYENEAV